MKWIILCLLSWDALAATDLSRVAIYAHGDVSKRYVQEIVLPHTHSRKIEAIIYGNEKSGFFSTEEFQNLGDGIRLKLLPPSYSRPIQFYAQIGNELEPLGTKFFTNPTPDFIDLNKVRKQTGTFSAPYILSHGTVDQISDQAGQVTQKFTYISLQNRDGEIVWLHFPAAGFDHYSNYAVPYLIQPGTVGFLTSGRLTWQDHRSKKKDQPTDGYIELVSWEGEILQQLHSKDMNLPSLIHHDFQLLDEQIYTFGEKSTFAIDRKAKVPGRYGKYSTNTILRIDAKTKRFAEVWDSNDHLSPLNYELGYKPDSNKKMRDFIHANGLTHYPGQGWLVSAREHSRVLMLSEDFKHVKWSIGPSPRDTFHIPEAQAFIHQYCPSLSRDGTLVLLDNKDDTQRLMEWELDHTSKQARLVWQFQLTSKRTKELNERGCVRKLANGNFLATLTTAAVLEQEQEGNADIEYDPAPQFMSSFLEVEAKTQGIVARHDVKISTAEGFVRAEPIYHLYRERYLGSEPPGSPLKK